MGVADDAEALYLMVGNDEGLTCQFVSFGMDVAVIETEGLGGFMYIVVDESLDGVERAMQEENVWDV